MAEHWYETIRIGDQFGRSLKSRPFTMVEPWDGRRLRAYRKDVGAVWLRVDDLRPCIPRDVDNMRRRIAGALESMPAVVEWPHTWFPFDGVTQEPGGGWLVYNADDEQLVKTVVDAASLVVPDDWKPPGPSVRGGGDDAENDYGDGSGGLEGGS